MMTSSDYSAYAQYYSAYYQQPQYSQQSQGYQSPSAEQPPLPSEESSVPVPPPPDTYPPPPSQTDESKPPDDISVSVRSTVEQSMAPAPQPTYTASGYNQQQWYGSPQTTWPATTPWQQQNPSNPSQQSSWQQPNYSQWGWGWPGQSTWLPPPSQGAWAGQQPWPNYQYTQAPPTDYQQPPPPVNTGEPPRSPGTPPLPDVQSSETSATDSYRDAPKPMTADNYRDAPEPAVTANYRDTSTAMTTGAPKPVPSGTQQHWDGDSQPASQPPDQSNVNYREVPPPGHVGSKHRRGEDSEENIIEGKRLRRDGGPRYIPNSERRGPLLKTPPAPRPQQQVNSPDKWPPKIKEYVSRAFAACSSDSEKEMVHRMLDEELNKVFADNAQWSIDWDAHPLPTDRHQSKGRGASRWDTPSPSRELLIDKGKPLLLKQDSPVVGGRPGRGRGRGRGKGIFGDVGLGRGRGKKKKGKKGKNRFAIDTTPSQVEAVSVEETKVFNERAQRFGKQGAADGNRNYRQKISIDELLKRTLPPGGDDGQVYWQDKTVEGTCQKLEKRYLRLTSAPDPSMVRPLSVLEQSLKHVCNRWKTLKDYHYACEQFKSIRQDLTIQTIRNDFTVLVYETHGRVALENGDRQEFNQCQTQLKSLYADGLVGHQAEFIAYRVLYFILTDKSADMSSMLMELTSDLRSVPCIEHALKVWSAWSLGNYHKLFKLFLSAPNLSGSLMDMFISQERKKALRTITKAQASMSPFKQVVEIVLSIFYSLSQSPHVCRCQSHHRLLRFNKRLPIDKQFYSQESLCLQHPVFRPSVTVDYVCSELGFGCRDDCLAFLVEVEAVMDVAQATIDCKLTSAKL